MAGFYSVDHGDLDHQAFGPAGRRFNRWEAYCWLLDHAAIGPQDVEFQGKPVKIDRGQVALSVGSLAKAWKWPKSSVQRFLDGLSREGFIVYSPITVADTSLRTGMRTVASLIVLCKYSQIYAPTEDAGTDLRTGARTSEESTQYKGSYVNKGRKENKGRKGRGTSSPTAPTAPSRQGDLLPTADVVNMPTDDVLIAFDAYRAVAKELGLAVPMHRLEGGRRSMLRQRLKELGGLEGWQMALEALRNATFITSGRWKAFSIDDMVTRKKLERLLAGGYSDVWDGVKREPPAMGEMRDHYREHHADSFYHDIGYTGTVKTK